MEGPSAAGIKARGAAVVDIGEGLRRAVVERTGGDNSWHVNIPRFL